MRFFDRLPSALSGQTGQRALKLVLGGIVLVTAPFAFLGARLTKPRVLLGWLPAFVIEGGLLAAWLAYQVAQDGPSSNTYWLLWLVAGAGVGAAGEMVAGFLARRAWDSANPRPAALNGIAAGFILVACCLPTAANILALRADGARLDEMVADLAFASHVLREAVPEGSARDAAARALTDRIKARTDAIVARVD